MCENEIPVTRSSMPPIEEYISMIKPLWDSHWITNMGRYHEQLESELENFLDQKYVALTVNGHLALELAIQAMNFPRGGEVITTPFTFISTTHAIVRNGLKPVFCDIKDDFTIDETKIEKLITDKTVAIIPVHVYGNPCNVESIQEIAVRNGISVIYDAAHAFGEVYHGKGIGSYGDMAIFSFHATKVFNTIEGGAVCCNNKEQYNRICNLRNFGIQSEESTIAIGGNVKMNEFSAAMGICNLRHYEEQIQGRKKAVEQYNYLLEGRNVLKLNSFDGLDKSNFAYFPVVFEQKKMRDRVYNRLLESGIHSRKYFYPLTSDVECYKDYYSNVGLKKARYYADRVLTLPLYSDLKEEDIEKCARIIIAAL